LIKQLIKPLFATLIIYYRTFIFCCKTGAVRIGTSGYTDKELVYSAFRNADNSYAFIVLNKSSMPKKINLYDGEKSFVHEVPAKAVVSYRWLTNK